MSSHGVVQCYGLTSLTPGCNDLWDHNPYFDGIRCCSTVSEFHVCNLPCLEG